MKIFLQSTGDFIGNKEWFVIEVDLIHRSKVRRRWIESQPVTCVWALFWSVMHPNVTFVD
jgi:hypothetical protein